MNKNFLEIQLNKNILEIIMRSRNNLRNLFQKKIYLIFIPVLFLTCKTYTYKSPLIVFVKDTIDLKLINSNTLIHTSYKIFNKGNDTLKILDVEPSCNCTVIDNYSKEILPNKEGSIPIEFDPEFVPNGQFIRRIAVLSNSAIQINILILKGEKHLNKS